MPLAVKKSQQSLVLATSSRGCSVPVSSIQTPDFHDQSHRILRRPVVEQITSLSRSTIYRLMGEGVFPQTIRLGSNSVGWFAADINNWLQARADESHCAARCN